MQLEDYFNFLALDDIRVKGTRIGIETILYDFIHRKRSPEQIAQTYPSLTLEQVYATILYYFTLNFKLSIGENLEELILIAKAAFEDEYQDQIINLPLP